MNRNSFIRERWVIKHWLYIKRAKYFNTYQQVFLPIHKSTKHITKCLRLSYKSLLIFSVCPLNPLKIKLPSHCIVIKILDGSSSREKKKKTKIAREASQKMSSQRRTEDSSFPGQRKRKWRKSIKSAKKRSQALPLSYPCRSFLTACFGNLGLSGHPKCITSNFPSNF